MSLNHLKRAADILKRAEYLVSFTGAGISADSGVPTFRGRDGLWNRFRAQDLATPEAFQRDPELVWRWYRWRMELIAGVKPNEAHKLLAMMEEGMLRAVITQNVDGLHQRAGSRRVIELHGSIWRARCSSCDFRKVFSEPPKDLPPRCPSCGSLLRPDVVWFGEPLPDEAWRSSVEEVSKCDVLLVIGTSGVVYPAAHLPILAKERGAFIIEVNPDRSALTDICDLSLRLRAAEFARRIEKLLDLSKP